METGLSTSVGELLLRKSRAHSLCGKIKRTPDVLQRRRRQIVPVLEAVLEVLAARRVLNRKTHFLKGDPAVIVITQHLYRGFLESTEKTSLSARFIVSAFAVISAIPDTFVRIATPGSARQSANHRPQRADHDVQARDRLGRIPE